MKITDAQKVIFLVDLLGDEDLEIYQAWVIWNERQKTDPLPDAAEFLETYRKLYPRFLYEHRGEMDFMTWLKEAP